jgi:hypothetical protein
VGLAQTHSSGKADLPVSLEERHLASETAECWLVHHPFLSFNKSSPLLLFHELSFEWIFEDAQEIRLVD